MPFEIGQLVRKTTDGLFVKKDEICTVIGYKDGGGCCMHVRREINGHICWVDPDCFELVFAELENGLIDNLFDEFS